MDHRIPSRPIDEELRTAIAAETHIGQPACGDVAYYGFTDTANVGDFALYQANIALFPKFRLIPGRAQARADAGLFGGGTLYPYSLTNNWYPRHRLIFGVGVGVQDPPPKGKFGLLTRLAMWRHSFRFFGVRGFRSKAILARHGIESTVTGDTALFFSPDTSMSHKPGRVCISLVTEPMQRAGSVDLVVREVLQCATRLQAEGFEIVLIPFAKEDVPGSVRMANVLGRNTRLVDFWSPDLKCSLPEFLRELQSCTVILAERLHSAVLASALGVPFLALGYKAKCFDFVESLKLSFGAIEDSRAVNAKALYSSIKCLLGKADAVKGELIDKVSAYRGILVESAKMIQREVLGPNY